MNNKQIGVWLHKRKSAQVFMLLAVLLNGVGATLNAQPAARMGISPDRYEVVFDERGGDTQSLMIQNLSDEELTVTLSVSHWDLDENNQLRIIPPHESSLDQWIVINPLRVTVPPGSPQTIRWAIMPRLKPGGGEYRAMLFIEEDLPPEQRSEGTQVRMKMRYGLPIYAHVGERIERAEFNGINIDRDNNRIFLDITNVGNVHGRLSGNYGIWRLAEYPGQKQALEALRKAASRQDSPDGFMVGRIASTVVLPEDRRRLSLDVVLANPGEYVAVIDAEIAGLEIVEAIELTQPET